MAEKKWDVVKDVFELLEIQGPRVNPHKDQWIKFQEKIRFLRDRVNYLEDTQDEIEKLVRTGKASCEVSNKKVLEDVEEILDG